MQPCYEGVLQTLGVKIDILVVVAIQDVPRNHLDGVLPQTEIGRYRRVVRRKLPPTAQSFGDWGFEGTQLADEHRLDATFQQELRFAKPFFICRSIFSDIFESFLNTFEPILGSPLLFLLDLLQPGLHVL